MPRKGWTRIEVPRRWTQPIRGPRPPGTMVQGGAQSVSRSCRGTTRCSGWGAARCSMRSGSLAARWAQPSESSESRSLSRRCQDESAFSRELAILEDGGDTGSPEVKSLQKSLAKARRAAQEPPFGVQLSLCEQFVERAKIRLTQHDEQRAAKELAEGEARIERLRAQVSNLPVPLRVICAEKRIAMLKGTGAGRSSPAGQREEASHNIHHNATRRWRNRWRGATQTSTRPWCLDSFPRWPESNSGIS